MASMDILNSSQCADDDCSRGHGAIEAHRISSASWAWPRNFDDNSVLPCPCASPGHNECERTRILHVSAIL